MCTVQYNTCKLYRNSGIAAKYTYSNKLHTTSNIVMSSRKIRCNARFYIVDVSFQHTVYCIYFQVRHRHLRNRLSLLFVFTSICLIFRLWIMNFDGPEFSPSDNPAAHETLFLTRFLTFSFLPVFNGKLLILPVIRAFSNKPREFLKIRKSNKV